MGVGVCMSVSIHLSYHCFLINLLYCVSIDIIRRERHMAVQARFLPLCIVGLSPCNAAGLVLVFYIVLLCTMDAYIYTQLLRGFHQHCEVLLSIEQVYSVHESMLLGRVIYAYILYV